MNNFELELESNKEELLKKQQEFINLQISLNKELEGLKDLSLVVQNRVYEYMLNHIEEVSLKLRAPLVAKEPGIWNPAEEKHNHF